MYVQHLLWLFVNTAPQQIHHQMYDNLRLTLHYSIYNVCKECHASQSVVET